MKNELRKALRELSIRKLSPVQEKAVPVIEEGKNVFVQAPTGSGKTLAYLIPAVDRCDALDENTKVLIITPTRELALQVSDVLQKVSVYTGIHSVTLIGGLDIHKQENALKHHPTILTGTPGRILDLLDQKRIHLDHLSMLIMDEADQILSTGQKEDVMRIISQCPLCQKVLVSATWKDELKDFLPEDTKYISLSSENQLNTHISAYVYPCTDKHQALLDLLHHLPVIRAIVFVKYKSTADELSAFLRAHQILSAPFSSYYDEKKRIHILKEFREGRIRVLCATDAAARGLDITDVSHVIHYDLPEDETDFIHRSGRSGHQGGNGMTILLKDASDSESFSDLKFLSLPETAGNDLSVPLKEKEQPQTETATLWINAGRKDRLRPKDIIGALCTVLSFEDLGALEIQDTSSTIVLKRRDRDLEKKLQDLKIKGKKRKYRILK